MKAGHPSVQAPVDSGPHVRVPLRHTVIGWFRLGGVTDVPATLRHHGRDLLLSM